MKGIAVRIKGGPAVGMIYNFGLRAAMDGDDATWVRYGVDASTTAEEQMIPSVDVVMKWDCRHAWNHRVL